MKEKEAYASLKVKVNQLLDEKEKQSKSWVSDTITQQKQKNEGNKSIPTFTE